MDIYQKSILEAINKAVGERLKSLSFNYKIEGRVEEVLLDGRYSVMVDKVLTKVRAINSDTYVVGDVVYIIVFNGNYSDKKILCKK